MIRVHLQPEPQDFDQKVRQKGLHALGELRGDKGLPPRPGPPRKPKATITAADLPAYWCECLDDLHEAYSGICAYSCFYIDMVTGAPSVDHHEAKSSALVTMRSEDLSKIYEWSNYRLACSRMNARKGTFADVLDPFEVEDGWFQIEFYEFQLRPADVLSEGVRKRVQDTIERLGLNDYVCRRQRGKFFDEYRKRHITFDYLTRHAPLIAREIDRQKLHPA